MLQIVSLFVLLVKVTVAGEERRGKVNCTDRLLFEAARRAELGEDSHERAVSVLTPHLVVDDAQVAEATKPVQVLFGLLTIFRPTLVNLADLGEVHRATAELDVPVDVVAVLGARVAVGCLAARLALGVEPADVAPHGVAAL